MPGSYRQAGYESTFIPPSKSKRAAIVIFKTIVCLSEAPIARSRYHFVRPAFRQAWTALTHHRSTGVFSCSQTCEPIVPNQYFFLPNFCPSRLRLSNYSIAACALESLTPLPVAVFDSGNKLSSFDFKSGRMSSFSPLRATPQIFDT